MKTKVKSDMRGRVLPLFFLTRVQLALKFTNLNHHQPGFLWLGKNEKMKNKTLNYCLRRKCAHTSVCFTEKKEKIKATLNVPSGK
jgi:hypothetical protein